MAHLGSTWPPRRLRTHNARIVHPSKNWTYFVYTPGLTEQDARVLPPLAIPIHNCCCLKHQTLPMSDARVIEFIALTYVPDETKSVRVLLA